VSRRLKLNNTAQAYDPLLGVDTLASLCPVAKGALSPKEAGAGGRTKLPVFLLFAPGLLEEFVSKSSGSSLRTLSGFSSSSWKPMIS